MKTTKIAILGVLLLIANITHAQVSVNVNIGTVPDWGPVGYRNMEYYYLPDIQSYYDVRASQFIYFGGGKWIRSSRLPKHHRNYDLYNGYKVVLTDYHGRAPYIYYDKHRVKYHKGYHGPQQSYRGRKENKSYGHHRPSPHRKHQKMNKRDHDGNRHH